MEQKINKYNPGHANESWIKENFNELLVNVTLEFLESYATPIYTPLH